MIKKILNKTIIFAMVLLFSHSSLIADCNKIDIDMVGNVSNMRYLDLLTNISETCNISYNILDKKSLDILKKEIHYISVKDFTFEKVLNIILDNNNLFYEYDKSLNSLKVFYRKTEPIYFNYVAFNTRTSSSNYTVTTSASAGAQSEGISGENTDTKSISYNSSFDLWENLNKEIEFILLGDVNYDANLDMVNINKEAGIINVTGNKSQINRIEAYISKLEDRLHKQILIETKIIQVTTSNNKKTGVDWSKFQLSLSGGIDTKNNGTISDNLDFSRNVGSGSSFFLNSSFEIDGLVKFLKTQGEVEFISNPSVLTLNNQPAIINVGKTINYRFDSGSTTNVNTSSSVTTSSFQEDSRFVGVTLDITPQISNEDDIILKINPVISSIEKDHFDANGVRFLAPDMSVKQLSSIVRVKDDQKVMIGGLISQDLRSTINSVPVLSAIPILGAAFKSEELVKEKTEVIIIVIPHLVNNKEQEYGSHIIKN